MRRPTPHRTLRRVMSVAALVGVALLGVTARPALGDAGAGPVTASGHDHHVAHGDGLTWGPAPAVFPPGAQMAVLQGDPSRAGEIFTVRLRFPNGYVIPPHTHPTDEHVTVIKGRFQVGLGDDFDPHAFLPTLGQGDFITAPAHASHFARARGRTEVQVHAIGPFQLDYVHPEDLPPAAR